jgi:hypothetical protein
MLIFGIAHHYKFIGIIAVSHDGEFKQGISLENVQILLGPGLS